MLTLLMAISVVFDVSEKLDEFMNGNAPVRAIIFEYYVNFVLYYANLFSALIVFLAVILFTAKMARDTEIVPVLSSGVTFNRFLRPFFIGASFLTVASLALNHFFIPEANMTRLHFEDKYDGKHFNVQNVHKETDEGKLVYFRSYYSTRGFIEDLWITSRNNSDSRVKSVTHATIARGDSLSDEWRLEGYFKRTFQGDSAQHSFVSVPILDTTLGFTLSEFTAEKEVASTLTTPELIRFIDSESKKGSTYIPFYKVELHQRTSYPIATYILTILGACLASRKARDSIGMNMALGLGLVMIYLFLIKMTTVAALNVGFSPFWAVWTPNIIFTGITYYVYRLTPK